MRVLAAALWVALAAGCSTVNTARLPQGTAGRGDVFVTTGDIKEPYTSLGVIQVTRKAVVIFGWIDPGGTDLDDALRDLIPEARGMGGDGVINLRFQQTQYLPWTRMLGLVLFIVPLPTEVTLTGEVVQLADVGDSVDGGRP